MNTSASNIPAWFRRLLDEEALVASNVEKLTAYFGTEGYRVLAFHQQFLLQKQLAAMTEYREILRARISIGI